MDDSARPESFFRRLLWRNSGLLCLVTLLTLPIILGVAIGYVIVLAVVTSYRKITGQKSREEKESEAKKKIRIILGHDLLESAFTKPVNLPGQRNKYGTQMPRYGSVNENSNIALSSDGSESEEDTDTDGEDSEGQTEEIREDIKEAQEDTCSDPVGTEESTKTSETYAQREGSGTASASSEYYSTASEMEERGGTATESLAGDNSAPDLTTSAGKQDTAIPEVSPEVPESPAKPAVMDSGVSSEEAPSVIPRNATNSHSKVIIPPALGKLKYSVEYIVDRNQLQVTILKAINLPEREIDVAPSSYVKVSLLPQRFCWQRTKVVENNRNPVYNETFVISGFSHERFRAYTLLICVINAVSQWQGYYGDHVIGEIYVPLSHVNGKDKAMCGWAELRPKMTEVPGLSKCGKINLSLCYRPISGRLIVTIKKARDLKCENNEKFDPYVKLALYCDGTRVGRGATRVKRRATNPVFNEKFNFDLTSDQIAYTTIVIKVVNNIDSNRACLGATVIGYESSGDGQEHWLYMMECLSQHVDAWHCLYS